MILRRLKVRMKVSAESRVYYQYLLNAPLGHSVDLRILDFPVYHMPTLSEMAQKVVWNRWV